MTISSGFISSYETPLGLITTRPCLRSIPLTLPHVNMTSPCFKSSRLASHTFCFSSSSINVIFIKYQNGIHSEEGDHIFSYQIYKNRLPSWNRIYLSH